MSEVIDGVAYLSGEEAAAALGVKKATLYAYVSRGMLQSYRQGIGRRRLYRSEEIQRLRSIRPDDGAEGARQPAGQVREPLAGEVVLPDAASWAGDH